MVEVGKLSILYLVIIVVIYVIIHIFIGLARDKAKKELDEKPGNQELESKLLLLQRVFKWFPAFMIVVVIILLWV